MYLLNARNQEEIIDNIGVTIRPKAQVAEGTRWTRGATAQTHLDTTPLYLLVGLSVCPPVCIPGRLPVYLSVCQSACMSIYCLATCFMSACLPTSATCLHLHICMHVLRRLPSIPPLAALSACMTSCMSVCRPTVLCLPVCLSCPFVCPHCLACPRTCHPALPPCLRTCFSICRLPTFLRCCSLAACLNLLPATPTSVHSNYSSDRKNA